jgi:hypothetical protein
MGLSQFRIQDDLFAPADAIGSRACSLEASVRVTNGIPLGIPHIFFATTTPQRTSTIGDQNHQLDYKPNHKCTHGDRSLVVALW